VGARLEKFDPTPGSARWSPSLVAKWGAELHGEKSEKARSRRSVRLIEVTARDASAPSPAMAHRASATAAWIRRTRAYSLGRHADFG